MRTGMISYILSIPGLLLALSLHEFAHGYAAYKMGDSTAKYDGRLSINPFHHLDIIGTICLLLFHFGWAKPVPINPYNFKNRRLGVIVVSLAGPMMNFVVALVSAILMVLSTKIGLPVEIGQFVYYVLYYSTMLNIGLMIFNLIPIPPLDGSRVLLEFLPYRYQEFFYRIERYSFLILLVLIYTNVLNPVLATLQGGIINIINLILGLIF